MLDRSDASGRRSGGAPVAIVDIGSNSVRLVAYEALARAPTPLFNDKVMCGLGRGVVTTQKLSAEGIDKALIALRRFRVLCRIMEIADIHAIATAAARDATNGPEFLAAATEAIGAPIELLSGQREAELSALGVVSGVYRADGVAGDLGGGSLELNEVKGTRLGKGTSLPLGGLVLADMSGRSLKKAGKIVRAALAKARPLEHLEGRTFYAIGGTWRALARLHMSQRNYPLNVMHHYVIPARDAADFAGLVERVNVDSLISITSVPAARRPLLAYGAVVLEEIIRHAQPREIVVSAFGVREGLLFERLDSETRKVDPLIQAAAQLNAMRSRAPQHGEELFRWTDEFFHSSHLEEVPEERRLRHAACLLSDIGWRAHPDYRGEQSLNLVAHGAFIGIDHPGRAFLAIVAAYRHMGPDADVSPQIRALANARMLDRAHILGAAMRLAYVISAAMPGILPRTPIVCTRGKLVLTLPGDLAPLENERLQNRLRQLARLLGREPVISAPSSGTGHEFSWNGSASI
jgi:exopolyphosphatase/guanosine-5'-triphosphate,3'-diphosphate pyrophosphatase